MRLPRRRVAPATAAPRPGDGTGDRAAAERYGVRVGAVAAGLVALGVPLCLLVLLVVGRWGPLLRLDGSVERNLHTAALDHPVLVHLAWALTFFGNASTRVAVAAAAVVVLLVRRAFRLAAFLAATGLVGGLLDTLVKLAVDRARPVLPDPITTAHGTSFPSGHAMGATVVYGALLLVALSWLPAAGRGPARALVAALVLGVGASRVVLGVHFPSDVVGGWLLGLAWLAASAAVFNVWRRERGEPPVEPARAGVEPEERRRVGADG